MSKKKTVLYTFKNHTKLTKILTFLLYTYLVASIVMTISSFFDYNLLSSMNEGVIVSNEAIDANDIRHGIFGLIWFIALLSTMVSYCFWLYRAINNARSFNSTDFTLRPNSTVGCYFVPFLNLYGPYQDMQKLWKVCKTFSGWKNEKSSSLIKWWWFFWIITNILFSVSSNLEEKATTINTVMNARIVDMSGYLGEAICALLLILLIKEIYKMQKETQLASNTSEIVAPHTKLNVT